MIISEDGSVTGSIDAAGLDSVEPKSDEAKAQLDALKRERDLGQETAAKDAERLAELHKAQSPEGQAEAQREVSTPADASGDPNAAAQKTSDQGDKTPARKSASSSGKE